MRLTIRLSQYLPPIGVDILLDTGAALSLIRDDIGLEWKNKFPEFITIYPSDQCAETCSG